VAKVSINGEYFAFDPQHKPMAEMLALEEATGLSYGEWESGMTRMSARALAALVWLLWKRDGREVPFADIVSGDLNLAEVTFEADGPPPDPTPTGAPTEVSPSTGTGTSARSRKS
jgi:hypothetical protein